MCTNEAFAVRQFIKDVVRALGGGGRIGPKRDEVREAAYCETVPNGNADNGKLKILWTFFMKDPYMAIV